MQKGFIRLLLGGHEHFDVHIGKFKSFEDRNFLLSETGIREDIVGLNFWEMDCLEMTDHAHYVLLFRRSCNGKIGFHLLYRLLPMDLT